jgi:hypothetical protein
MIKLYAPRQLQLSVDEYIRSTFRNVLERSKASSRLLLVAINGEKSFRNFHENRTSDKPFYNLGQVNLLRAFPDPLGVYEAYYLYLVSESVETMLHTMEYVDNPDDFLHIDNPYRGFVTEITQPESTDNDE